MGISDGTPGSGVDFDCSAGTIVWVRRRNGSWWPGKILDTDELSPSHLMSPRSGTPVKLLGRDDASVDWYNLEKSKRVKPFRCGEFDDCIEKAEKSHGVLIRKREKYARREDAILHALEIETEQLEKKQKKLVNANSASSRKPKVLKKTLAASSERRGNGDCKFVNLRSQSLTKGLDSSLKEESIGNPLNTQRGIHGKQSSGEEDKPEAIPRMRGLQDFGLRIAPKRKAPASVISEGSRRPSSVDNHLHVLPSGSRSLGGGPVATSKNSLAFKRKKTHGGLVEESLVKRRDRRRPLVQVLQSSAKLPANHTMQSHGDISPSMPGEKEQSGVICRAKRSRCIYLPAESNGSLDRSVYPSDEMQISPSQFGIDNCHLNPGSFTEENTTSGFMDEADCDSSESDPDMDEKQAVLSVPNNGCIQRETESVSSEELGEAAAAVNDYTSHHHSHDEAASDVGVSKWQLKGKRNARNLMKRSMDKGGKLSNGPIQEAYLEGKGNWSNQTALGQQSRYHHASGYNEDEDGEEEEEEEDDEDEDEGEGEDEGFGKNSMRNQVPGFGDGRYPSMLNEVSKDQDGDRSSNTDSDEEDTVWERDGLSQAAAAFRGGGYWDESGECYDPMYNTSGGGKDSCMLVDVDLKVQSSYQGEHVPLVSLMSRLNGKAIIGHPIQIEVLEDGVSDVFLSTSTRSGGEEAIYYYNDGTSSKAALPPVWRTARRTAMHRIPRSTTAALNGDDPDEIAGKSTEKKFPKKAIIKKVSLPGQKTRTLSSIATQQRLNGSRRSGLDGLIKPVNGPTATVTCIPVKLVFSRLLEAVGRPPSRPNHIVSDTRRKQVQGSILSNA